MKKLLLLFISLSFLGCDTDDFGNSNGDTPNVMTVTVVDIRHNQATIEWTRPSQAEGSVIYEVVLDNQIIVSNRTATQYVIQNLSPETEYSGIVKGLDETGKETFGNFSFRTTVIGGTEVHVGNYGLSYQFQVDNLAASNITTITGRLSINSADITDLSPLTDIVSVGSLKITSTNLVNLNGLQNVVLSDELKSLNIWGNSQLQNISAITASNSEFDYVRLEDNRAFQDLSGIRMSENGSLQLDGLDLSTLNGLQTASSLDKLELSDLRELNDISALQSLETIGTLYFYNLNNLNSLNGLQNLVNCGQLKITDTDNIASLSPLGNLTSCSDITLIRLNGLTSLEGFEGITRLDKLGLSRLPQINSFNGLQNLTEVGMDPQVLPGEDVFILGNLGITDLSGLDNLTRIRNLRIQDNDNLLNLDGSSLVDSWDINSDKRLNIGRNPLLTDFCGLSEFVQNANLNAHIIAQNGYNPTLEQIMNPAECSL